MPHHPRATALTVATFATSALAVAAPTAVSAATAGGAAAPIVANPIQSTVAPVVGTHAQLISGVHSQIALATGSRVSASGQVGDGGAVTLYLRAGGPGGARLDPVAVRAGHAFTLRATAHRGQRLSVVAVDAAGRRDVEPLGTVTKLRQAEASFFGPGLYGSGTACGPTLTPSLLGVANKTLPCGTKVTLRYGGRSVRVPVVDRGPYVGNREYDLTYATKQAIGFGSTGRVWVSR
jgi:rare lipoprotein A